jgi:hypothetical protein
MREEYQIMVLSRIIYRYLLSHPNGRVEWANLLMK